MSQKPKLKLIGRDGNAFVILAEARKVAKKYGMNWEIIQEEATASDYNHLLSVMMKYFDVE